MRRRLFRGTAGAPGRGLFLLRLRPRFAFGHGLRFGRFDLWRILTRQRSGDLVDRVNLTLAGGARTTDEEDAERAGHTHAADDGDQLIELGWTDR